MKILKSFNWLLKAPVYFYKYCISPIIPHVCRFTPTCSSYFIAAVDEFGIFQGAALGVKRICRCTPNNSHYGYDPVPINIKGDSKWLF